MSAETAEAIVSVRNRRRPDRPFNQAEPQRLKIAGQPAGNRVDRLVDLANTILQEIETLARDQVFTRETDRVETLLLSDGIDLFEELKRFEINLIRLALKQTRGHQARAAELLSINPTTLNSKLKVYGIKY